MAYIYCLPFEVCITEKLANVLYRRSLPLCARIRLTTALLPFSRFLNFSGSSPCISDTCLLSHFMQIEDQPTTGMLSEIYLCAYFVYVLIASIRNLSSFLKVFAVNMLPASASGSCTVRGHFLKRLKMIFFLSADD